MYWKKKKSKDAFIVPPNIIGPVYAVYNSPTTTPKARISFSLSFSPRTGRKDKAVVITRGESNVFRNRPSFYRVIFR